MSDDYAPTTEPTNDITITLPPPPIYKCILLDKIIKREDLQPRLALDDETVTAYAKIYTEHGPRGMEAIRVHETATPDDYILTRGFTRCAAAELAGLNEIYAEILPPATAASDLLLDSLGGNKHGLRLSSADKRRAVELYHQAIDAEHWGSSRDVGKLIGCSHELVAAYRRPTMSEIDNSIADQQTIILTAIAQTLEDFGKPLSKNKLLSTLKKSLPAELIEYADQHLTWSGWDDEAIDESDIDIDDDDYWDQYDERQQAIKENSDKLLARYDIHTIRTHSETQFCTVAYIKNNLSELIYKTVAKSTGQSYHEQTIAGLAEDFSIDEATIREHIANDDRVTAIEITKYIEPDRDDFASDEEWEAAPEIETTEPGYRLNDELIKKNKEAEQQRLKKSERQRDPRDYQTDRLAHIRQSMANYLNNTHGIELTYDQLAEIVLHIGLEDPDHYKDEGKPADVKTWFNGVVLSELERELECGWRGTDELPALDKLCKWIGADYDAFRVLAENTHPEPTPEQIAAYEKNKQTNRWNHSAQTNETEAD